MPNHKSVQAISVIVPINPFTPSELQGIKHCLAALDVVKLMNWWPGEPHVPHRNPAKVNAIQRSLDWKRVAQIAAYLLQKEIVDAPDRIDEFFKNIYEPKQNDPGREWPPRLPRVIGFQKSDYPTFSNVLLHVNGARIVPLDGDRSRDGTARLEFDDSDAKLNFAVIDGQHRINGAYFAIKLMQETKSDTRWDVPAEVFLDLDPLGSEPRRQAQIFIDINSYQKKVDKSLVADLFPTARGARAPIDDKERAQDLGRKLMLEVGPLVGMIQIPGIKYGVKDVVTLATLNGAIEDSLEPMSQSGIDSLDAQASFLAQSLDAWLIATGRKEEIERTENLDPNNVAYQGRVVVSFMTLIAACIWKLRKARKPLISEDAHKILINWLGEVMDRAGLRKGKVFLSKSEFKNKGYLGSGGLARFRNILWAASLTDRSVANYAEDKLEELAQQNRETVDRELNR